MQFHSSLSHYHAVPLSLSIYLPPTWQQFAAQLNQSKLQQSEGKRKAAQLTDIYKNLDVTSL